MTFNVRNFPLLLAVAIALVIGLQPSLHAQATLTSTATTANVGQLDQCLNVTSTSGMTAPGTLGQTTTQLFIDKEPMTVTSVPSATQVCVTRNRPTGAAGLHASGAVVWFGPPNYFATQDPAGACVPSQQLVLPRINTANGRIFTCFANGQGSAGEGLWAQENVVFVSPNNCGSLATTTTTTDNGMVPAATGNVVHQFTTNGTGGTTEITCSMGLANFPTLSSGSSTWVGDVSLLYGVQTTAISSIAAATVKSVTYPAAGGAAAGTVAAIGTTYTVTPSSLQTATTTTGLCYNERLLFGTPYLLNADVSQITFDQVFTNSAAATVYQVCGLLVHTYTVPPAY